MTKLVLFDIDGTLLASAQGTHEAFAVAFQKVYGVYAAIQTINHHGKTDQQIIHEVLADSGLSHEEIESKIDECMDVMCDYFATIQDKVHATPLLDVEKTLDYFESKDYLMGLVTGNLEPMAHAKLASVGLDKYFRVGGFGNEAFDRADLVLGAIHKAETHYNFKVSNNVYLFGDAPQDIQAGKRAGVKTIGVTTGIYTKSQLEEAGAKVVVLGVSERAAIEAVEDGR